MKCFPSEKNSDNMKFAIGSIGISMKDVAIYDGRSNGMFGNDASMTNYQNANEKIT